MTKRTTTPTARDVRVNKTKPTSARGAVAEVLAAVDPRRGGVTRIKLTSAAARSLRDQLDAIIDD